MFVCFLFLRKKVFLYFGGGGRGGEGRYSFGGVTSKLFDLYVCVCVGGHL